MDVTNLSEIGVAGVAALALLLFGWPPRRDAAGRWTAGGIGWMLVDAVRSIPDRLEPHFQAIRDDLTKTSDELAKRLHDPRRDSDLILTRAQREGVRAFVRAARALTKIPALKDQDLSGPIAHLEAYAKEHASEPGANLKEYEG